MNDLYEDLNFNEQRKKAELIIRHPFCKNKLSILRERLENIGCEVPEGGFSSHEELKEWRSKFQEKTSEPDHKKKYEREIEKVTEGKDEWGSETQEHVEQVRKRFYPLPGQIFREIMRYFNINPENDKGWQKFFRNYFFLNKKVYPYPSFSARMTRNDDAKREELWVRIFGHTRKEDICEGWDSIKEMQKGLDSYVGRKDKFPEIDKHMDIFNTYRKIEENNPNMEKEKIYAKTSVRVEDKYQEIDPGNVKNIISRIERRLEIN